MLARRAASALAAAVIARPASACLAACESHAETFSAAIGPAAAPSGGEAAAVPSRLPPSGPGSTGGLWGVPGRASQPCAAKQLKLLHFFSASSCRGLGERLSSSSSSSSREPGGIDDRSGLSEVQLQTAAERLMRLSRDSLKQPKRSVNTDESMQQRMALLLRLGFSQAAIEKAVKRRGGGPYIAEQHIGEAVALLRRWGFSQQQLDGGLAGRDAFSRAPADVEAVMAWLQREFGLQPSGVVRACSRAPEVLELNQATLEANWRAFEAAYQPTAAARRQLSTALRAGHPEFLEYQLATVRQKTALLQQLFQVPDHRVPDYIGSMAFLIASNIPGTVQPRLAFLQALTGVPDNMLAERVLRYPSLLRFPEATLQRNRDALVATIGAKAASSVLKVSPHVLLGVEDRAALNIASLQQLFGVARDGAVLILRAHPTLLLYDMQDDSVAAMLRGRVAFWAQMYRLPTAEAAVVCANMLPRRLRTVAPRAAFYRQQLPDAGMPHCMTFAKADNAFCSLFAFELDAFAAFKTAWLASEEGRAACRHEAAK